MWGLSHKRWQSQNRIVISCDRLISLTLTACSSMSSSTHLFLQVISKTFRQIFPELVHVVLLLAWFLIVSEDVTACICVLYFCVIVFLSTWECRCTCFCVGKCIHGCTSDLCIAYMTNMYVTVCLFLVWLSSLVHIWRVDIHIFSSHSHFIYILFLFTICLQFSFASCMTLKNSSCTVVFTL